MMSFKKKLRKFIGDKKEQIERGRDVTLQMQAERMRKRQQNMIHMKDGPKKAIVVGLMNKDSPLDVMKNEYHRRKYEREQKKD